MLTVMPSSHKVDSRPFRSTDSILLHSDLASLCLRSLPECIIVLVSKVNTKALYRNKHIQASSMFIPLLPGSSHSITKCLCSLVIHKTDLYLPGTWHLEVAH